MESIVESAHPPAGRRPGRLKTQALSATSGWNSIWPRWWPWGGYREVSVMFQPPSGANRASGRRDQTFGRTLGLPVVLGEPDEGRFEGRLDAGVEDCGSGHARCHLDVDRFDEQLQTDLHRLGLDRFSNPHLPAIPLPQWILGLPSKDAALWRASKVRIPARSCWFGACCIERVSDSDCTERTTRALLISSYRSTRPPFSSTDVFGMATVVPRASYLRADSTSGVRRSNATSAATPALSGLWRATAGALL